ncbi:hypothetical protein [Paracoccus niistensis]|uniref:Right-handed parallel beta-helix repeat-containing protein n=1 Tax=Paracoccus niistensis TaxID=632935 RepID=A0ABV6I864_9RHOB
MRISSDLIRAGVLALGVAAALAAALPGLATAQPVQVVDVCGRDDAPGGLNLRTALAQNGQIRIECPPDQPIIEITQTLALSGDADISAVGPITLRGPASAPMFTTSRHLRLSGLTLNNPASVVGSIVAGDQARIELDHVEVYGSPAAFLVRSLKATASRFRDNGDPAASPGNAVVNAEDVQIQDSEFIGNSDHPIAGGAWPSPNRIALSRRVEIDKTSFAGNVGTVLLIDARVRIRASQFSSNGLAPDSAKESWGCCGGAITAVRSDIQIFDSEFWGNASPGFGGAIQAIGSRLTVMRSTFTRNEARAGGAVVSWGRPPLLNIWSVDPWIDLPRLLLSRTTFNDNNASEFGGGILFAGEVVVEGSVLRGNRARQAGGAIAAWNAATLPDPHEEVIRALLDSTVEGSGDQLSISRSILVQNDAEEEGAALALAETPGRIGNTIIARNGNATAVTGSDLHIVNSVIGDNLATGLSVSAMGIVEIGNTILLRNAGGNCALEVEPVILGASLQDGGTSCGEGVATGDPGLDESYAPGLVSPARDGGTYALCLSDPLVLGVDLYSKSRSQGDGTCAIGAVERKRSEVLIAFLTFGAFEGDDGAAWLWWLLLLLALLAFLITFWRRRQRSRRTTEPASLL